MSRGSEDILRPLQAAALFGTFALMSFALLQPALHGEFINDDFVYIINHPYVNPLNAENLIEILDPFGAAMLHGVNYAPVQLLVHALERLAFGDDTFGYHVINVLMHALNSVLLVALLRRSRVPLLGAVLGGAIFAVHPANVEVVAWMSQLKTSMALAACMGAVLALGRFPKLATTLFVLGLLSKASAATALPWAAALCWARGGPRRDWVWLGIWLLLLALFAVPELAAHRSGGGVEVAAFSDLRVHVQTIGAIGARYLVMAATSLGISAFHEPDPVLSSTDPWWIVGVVAGLLFAWRTASTLRSRSEEGAYWIAAGVSYLPISQVSPFLHPMADRYLYFILPGLIGGTLLAAQAVRSRWLAAPAVSSTRRATVARFATRAAIASSLVVVLGFSLRSHARAPLWQQEIWLIRDSAVHFPQGGTASYWRAVVAANKGDVETTVFELRKALGRGLGFVRNFSNDRAFDRVRGHPSFHRLLDDVALQWIAHGQSHQLQTQPWLRSVASAYRVRGEYDHAIDYFERSARVGGPLQSIILAEMEETRAERRNARADHLDNR
jgi:hypothetical protein